MNTNHSPIGATEVNIENFGEFAGALLTPVSVVVFAFAAWRFGSDLGWTGEFLFSEGLLSHWIVWFAIGIFIQICAANLKSPADRNSAAISVSEILPAETASPREIN